MATVGEQGPAVPAALPRNVPSSSQEPSQDSIKAAAYAADASGFAGAPAGPYQPEIEGRSDQMVVEEAAPLRFKGTGVIRAKRTAVPGGELCMMCDELGDVRLQSR